MIIPLFRRLEIQVTIQDAQDMVELRQHLLFDAPPEIAHLFHLPICPQCAIIIVSPLLTL